VEPVIDDTRPTIGCGGLDRVEVAPDDACEVTIDLEVPEAVDECGIANLTWRYREIVDGVEGDWSGWMTDPNSQTFAVGVYDIQWRARDVNGNARRCIYTLEVLDETDPDVVCNDITIDFNGENVITWTVEELGSATDACGVADLSIDLIFATCEQIGEVIPVTVTAVDVNGNDAECIAYVTVDGLPCGWMTWDDHINCPGSSADYNPDEEEFYLTSADCSHAPFSPFTEEYAYVKTEICGDGEIITYVEDLDGLGKAWAGIVMRETNSSGSKKFQLMTGKDYLQHRIDWRSSTGGTNQTQTFSRFGQHWLRIVRTGDVFQAYTSFDGVSWGSPVNTQLIPMGSCIEVGLIVTNVPFATNVTATFSHVTVNGANGSDPNRPDGVTSAGNAAFQLQVAPNPTSGQLLVDLGAFLEEAATLEVLDINGRQLLQRSLGVIEQRHERLDLGAYPAGLYFIRLRTESGQTAVQRVIRQ
jgi:hypothetical protein